MLEGLYDYQNGRHSIPACLVRMAMPRLRRAGIISAAPLYDAGAELELYQLVSSSDDPRSYSRYNSLVRELISFEHALDHRMARSRPA
jgi:hypothetical protein